MGLTTYIKSWLPEVGGAADASRTPLSTQWSGGPQRSPIYHNTPPRDPNADDSPDEEFAQEQGLIETSETNHHEFASSADGAQDNGNGKGDDAGDDGGKDAEDKSKDDSQGNCPNDEQNKSDGASDNNGEIASDDSSNLWKCHVCGEKAVTIRLQWNYRPCPMGALRCSHCDATFDEEISESATQKSVYDDWEAELQSEAELKDRTGGPFLCAYCRKRRVTVKLDRESGTADLECHRCHRTYRGSMGSRT